MFNPKQIETLSSHLEVRTLPQGLPDAPVDVQVDVGSEPGTLTIMWLPVTITQGGLSNGAPVTGYLVCGDGRQLMEVDDGTADSAVVRLGESVVTSVTVRTKSNDKLSAESSSCPVPQTLLVSNKKNQLSSKSALNDDSDSDSELIEKLQNHPVIAGPPRARELVINYSAYPDIDSDIGPSELSDIAEEPEDEYSDSENDRRSTPKIKTTTTKFDLSNMYKNPMLNNNVWRSNNKKVDSSQVNNSQFEAQSQNKLNNINNKNN